MIKRGRKSFSFVLAFCIILTSFSSISFAQEINNELEFEIPKNFVRYYTEEDLELDFLESYSDIISPSSVTGMVGPIPGYIEGRTVSKSNYQNFAQAAIAAAFIAKLHGIPVGDVSKVYGGLMFGLQAIGYSEVFYTRTLYESPDGFMYYYKYVFYSDSGHNHEIETTYSYVYGKWAR